MRRLAIDGARTVEVQRLAYTLGSPVEVERYLRSSWIIIPDPPDVEFIRKPDFQIQDARQERIDVTALYSDLVPQVIIPAGYYAGDCDDASTLAASILYALHWPSSLIAIRTSFQPDFSHVFVRTFIHPLLCQTDQHIQYNVAWIDIDPIVPRNQLPLQNVQETMEVPL